ncbi:DUF4158 domain-containing protein [Streptomyces sp. NPDC048248]|uniref:DUF4158 domain-containing protein n=1 Tax=Streptomyces sp. NPDC048248 TaxID=3365523 RepID=UPI003715ED6F
MVQLPRSADARCSRNDWTSSRRLTSGHRPSMELLAMIGTYGLGSQWTSASLTRITRATDGDRLCTRARRGPAWAQTFRRGNRSLRNGRLMPCPQGERDEQRRDTGRSRRVAGIFGRARPGSSTAPTLSGQLTTAGTMINLSGPFVCGRSAALGNSGTAVSGCSGKDRRRGVGRLYRPPGGGEDRKLIAKRRGDHNRLGFALQMCTVRYIGLFLEDPLAVPWPVIEHVGEQLSTEDVSCIKRYTERQMTAYQHAWEIRDAYGYHPYDDAEWGRNSARSCTGGRGRTPRGWWRCSTRRGGLAAPEPGAAARVSVLARQVSEVRQIAEKRLHATVASRTPPSRP